MAAHSRSWTRASQAYGPVRCMAFTACTFWAIRLSCAGEIQAKTGIWACSARSWPSPISASIQRRTSSTLDWWPTAPYSPGRRISRQWE